MAFSDHQIQLKALTDEHVTVSTEMETFMAEYRGKDAPADQEVKLDRWVSRLDEIETEAKAVADKMAREDNIAKRVADAEAWRSKSGPMLRGMSANQGDDGEGASRMDTKRAGGSSIEFKDGFAYTTTRDGKSFPLVSTEDWEANRALKASATPEYKAQHLRHLRGQDFDVKALSEGVDTAGGYLVPPEFLATVITRLPGLAIVEPNATVRQTTRDRVEVPRMKASTTDTTMYTSNVRATMVGEVAGSAETEPAWEMLGVSVWTAKLETELGRNMVADTAFDVEGFLMEEYQRAATLLKDDKFLTGSGVHEPVGLMVDSEITEVNTGHASEVTADGWIELIFDLPAQYSPGALVAMSRSCRKATAKLKDGDGAYLFDSAEGTGRIASGRPRTILGEPYQISDFLDSVGAGLLPAIYGNMRFYWVHNRLALSVSVAREQPYLGRNAFGYIAFLRFAGHTSVPEAFRRLKVSA